MSYVVRRKVGSKIYLEERESYRQNGKVKARFLRYLGPEGDTLRKPIKPRHIFDQINPSFSSREGDVSLLWKLAKDLQIPQTIDRLCPHKSAPDRPSPGVLLTVWAINRVLYPESATQLEKWVPTTDISRLTGIPPDAFTKDTFLASLDKICGEDPDAGVIVDRSDQLDAEIYRLWREANPLPKGEREILAYDLTSVLFFGVTCPLSEFGYNALGISDQLQVNLALLVSQYDEIPVAHAVYEGSRHGAATVKNILARLLRTHHEHGTLIWDRGMVSADHVRAVEDMGWKLICGLPKTTTAVIEVLNKTEVPWEPETLVRITKTTKIYAVLAEAKIYGKDRRLVVYQNMARAQKERDGRNEALAKIAERFEALESKWQKWTEARIHHTVKEVVGRWGRYMKVHVSRNQNRRRVIWKYRRQSLREAERTDGKWILLVTDPTVSAAEAVELYLEKDFIEKGFRTMKTEEEMEPVRHRLERRVRAYEFVQVLALRLRAALRWRMREVAKTKGMNAWEATDDLLQALGRVERVEVSLGKQQRIWHLNLLKGTRDILEDIGYGELFGEKVSSILECSV